MTTTRWPLEYSSKFNRKIINLKNPLASHRIRRLCEWIAEQKDPSCIDNITTCEEVVNKKLFFSAYGWHIVFKFEKQEIIFIMFYNAPDGMK